MKRMVLASLVAVSLGACRCDSIKRPQTSDLVVHGVVSQSDGSGAASPLSGAAVRVGVDRNADGKIEPGESVTATSGEDGRYTAQMKVEQGERVVVRFSASGAAPSFKVVQAGPWAELSLNATLRDLEDLDCSGARCALEGNRLSLGGLPEGVTGAARLFNPEKETQAFPGGFRERTGNLLISGVFGAVQLEDASGNLLDTLAAPAELRMRIPKETWGVIVDSLRGDGRIQVPLYSFDEASGEWVADGQAVLETAAGEVIPESALAEIRSGSFSGGIFAAGQVSHFSYWNVDWPVATQQCLRGTIRGDDGEPAPGATVQVSGVTYTGGSELITVGPDGAFCVQVMRSEQPGESVDNNATLGETHRVRLRVSYGGKLYDGGEYEVPVHPATCGAGECLELGEIELSTKKEIVPRLCQISGKLTDHEGLGLEGVSLFFNDPSVPPEVRESLCGLASYKCTLLGFSRGGGEFEVTTPVLDGAFLISFSSEEDTQAKVTLLRMGFDQLEECPARRQDLVLNEGFATASVEVAVQGGQISWSGGHLATLLQVDGPDGAQKWALVGAITGPVTYGVLPANAEQLFPEVGAPEALSTGDRISVVIGGEFQGLPLAGAGETQAP